MRFLMRASCMSCAGTLEHSARTASSARVILLLWAILTAQSATIESMAAKTTVIPNGPLKIEGEVMLVDGQGQEFGLSGRTTIFLCRCSLSENKPFCDGSHKR